MKYDIFISYRRIGGQEIARSLKSELELRGYHVFLDYDDLKDGVFDQRIMDAIENSPIFMIILSPHALDYCMNEGDWVRKEIEYALQQNCHIIPINPDQKFEGFPYELPISIKSELGQHQFSEIMMGQLFKASINKMIQERIEPIITQLNRIKTEDNFGAIIHIEADMDCQVLRFGKRTCLVKANEDKEIRLRKGKHKMEFISLENKVDRKSMIFIVEDNDMEDILTVELLPIKETRLKKEMERKQKELEIWQKERLQKKRVQTSIVDNYKSQEIIKTVVPEDARPKFKPVGKIDLDKLNRRPVQEKEQELNKITEENEEVLKIGQYDFVSKINYDFMKQCIDLTAANQYTCPKIKSKKEKRKEKEEKEQQRQIRREQMKEDILKEIRSTTSNTKKD